MRSPEAAVVSNTSTYQPLALCAGAAMLGIMADRFGPNLPFPIFSGTTLVLVLLGGWFVYRENSRIASVLLLCAVAVLFGLRHHLWFECFDARDLGFFATITPAPAVVEGVVLEMPRLEPPPESTVGYVFAPTETTRLLLRAERIRDRERWTAATGCVDVAVPGNRTDVRIGDRVRVHGEIAIPRGPSNPGDPDRRRTERGRRVLTQMRLPSEFSVEIVQKRGFSVARALETLRRRAHDAFRVNMNGNTAPLAAAMILGIREDVGDDTQQRLRETGTIHILAISGLHVGLLAAMVGWGLRFLGVSRQTTAAILIGTTLLYLFLTDMRPPAVRASALVIVASFALFFNRRVISVNSLALTALIVLTINPTELFQFGAQLSFIGTGVFLWKPPVPFHRLPGLALASLFHRVRKNDPQSPVESESEPRPSGSGADTKKTGEGIRTTNDSFATLKYFVRRAAVGLGDIFGINILIWLALMPLLMERIHLFTPVAILLNPLLWPALAFSLLAGFAVLFGAVVDAATGLHLAGYCGAVADTAFTILVRLVDFFHSLPYGYAWTPGPPPWWNVVLYPPLVLFTLVPGLCPRPRTLLASIGIWILVGVASGYVRDADRFFHDRLTVDVCGVGHGLAVLVIAPDGATTVYDAGSLTSPYTSANVLSRQLWRNGKTRIDRLMLSHPDSDHYNGVPLLAERFAIGAVYVPPDMFAKRNEAIANLEKTLERHDIPIRYATHGLRIADENRSSGERPRMEFLHPPAGMKIDMEKNSNAASLVLLIEHRTIRILLPGDLDMETRPPFLREPPIDLDVLLLPHHGGSSGMTRPLIEWGRPEHLVVSSGSFNRKPGTRERRESEGFPVHDTFDGGMISIRIDTKGFRITDFLAR